MKAQPITAKTRGQISQSFTIKWDGRVFQALFATSRVCYLVILHSVRCFEILDETGSTRMPRRATLDRSEMGSGLPEEKNAAAMAETTAAPGLQARPSPIPVPDHDMGVGNFVLS
ncbi:hypothetical protein AAC387_Pa05g3619 [Persea americana]